MPPPLPDPPSRTDPSPSSDTDLTTTMGFSSFGAKPNPPKKKKRKFANYNNDNDNHNQANTTEGVVVEATGSNDTPLGLRTRKSQHAAGGEGGGGVQSDQGVPETVMRDGGVQGRRPSKRSQQQRRRGAEEEEPSSSEEEESEGGGGEAGGGTQTTTRTSASKLPTPDPLVSAAMDETAAMLLETGILPRYLDWGAGPPPARGNWVHGKGEGRGGKKGDGGEGWRDGEGADVAFYDRSFVEDPWRGLRGEREEGGKG